MARDAAATKRTWRSSGPWAVNERGAGARSGAWRQTARHESGVGTSQRDASHTAAVVLRCDELAAAALVQVNAEATNKMTVTKARQRSDISSIVPA